ncbi:hypothetical protein BB561_003294 [Smittium simulii]|uniref:F-box domain-containing protein n=1 Tax=Smittium simulii TaxID=133385 RepID=A0A2T9YM49_9FUNG|nr:hypothetical protein BB561_003294 [Smittium simulii]
MIEYPEEKKFNDLIIAGKRCLKAHKYNNSIEIFTELLGIKSSYSKTKVYGYRAFAFYNLKSYDKALKDAQKTLLLDSKNPNAYWLTSKIMWELCNKPGAISVLQSGILNSDKTNPNYNSLKGLLGLYTSEMLTKKKKLDPLFDIPIEITFFILEYFSITELISLKRVCKSWKNFIDSSQILWKDVTFLQQNTSTLTPRTFFIKDTLNSNLILKDHSETSYKMSFLENTTTNCFKNNCYNLYFADNFIDNQKFFKKQPISEKIITSSINNASSQLASIIIPDSRNLGSGFISALTKKSHPRLSTFCVSRLSKITETSKILPLIRNFLHTNHLTKLCFSYNSLITSEIVYNIGLHCTNLKTLDLSCTPNVDWGLVLTQTAKHSNKEWFKELQELYVENQLHNYILVSNNMSQLGINFKKLKTLSLAWNINKYRLMGLSTFNPFTEAEKINYRIFELNFAAFPNLIHACLDGLFEIYTPVLSFGLTSTDVVNSNTYIPNFCLFSCASSNNLSNNFFISMLQHSKKLKYLNLAKSRNIQNSFIESILHFSSFLTVLNLTECVGLSASDLNLLIQQCSQHLEILELASTNADDSTQLTLAKFMPKCIRKINLDQTLSTGSGLLAISKAIKNMYYLCSKCNSILSDFENYCNCLESIQAYQENKIKDLDILNLESRTPKRKFSELGKLKVQNTQNINNKNHVQSSNIQRSNITIKNILISVKNCNYISLEAVENSREQLKGTLTKILYQFC